MHPHERSAGAAYLAARLHGVLRHSNQPPEPICAIAPAPSPTHSRLLLHLQEVAGNHGVALWGRTEEGFATDPIMVANNLIFVATRIQIRMERYPKWYASAASARVCVFAHRDCKGAQTTMADIREANAQ